MSDQPVDTTTESEKVNINNLNSASVAAVGLVAVTALQSNGLVILQVGDNGYIELVPIGELELDLLPESDALNSLIEMNYTDGQLSDYLRQRSSRAVRKQKMAELGQ